MATTASAPGRVIRVFVSSTFRDMHAERDHLVTVIFPQLRSVCESRGVTWGEVDLRWGVTDEEAAEGRVLPICLEEIQRCRPYFISLLGERYGWVPREIPADLLEYEGWLREQVSRGKSVTELEILHGVLRNPAMAGHAFFYFRDPTFIDRLPAGAQRADFVSEDPESASKLRDLKRAIKASGFPVREAYPSPDALGELVLQDLTAVIDALFPEGSQPDPLIKDALEHDAYARSRARVYVQRAESFGRLDRHIDDGTKLPLVVVGEPGSGKSALLANWAARHRLTRPDEIVIEHYIGATPASADWAAMLRRLMGELNERCHLGLELPHQKDALSGEFPNWLAKAAPRQRLVLLLDALNQLDDRDMAQDLPWLPRTVPENVRLIVSTVPGRSFDETSKRGWPSMTVRPLGADERREVIRAILAHYGRTLSPERVDRIARVPAAANPLYLSVLLNELRLFGQHERLDERIAYYLAATSPLELYAKVIANWEERYEGDTDLVGETLALLWAARSGLSESELLAALGNDTQPLPRFRWSALFLAMSEALVNRNGLLTFAHGFLREAARNAYLPTPSHERTAHARLAAYFGRQEPSARQLAELPWQLAACGDHVGLLRYLQNPSSLWLAWKHEPQDLLRYWTQLEGNGYDLRDAYAPLITTPRGETELEPVLSVIASLFHNAGHFEEEVQLLERLAGRANPDPIILGQLARALLVRQSMDRAEEVAALQETVCRGLSDWPGLAHALGTQGMVLMKKGRLRESLAKHRERERVCRERLEPPQLQDCLDSLTAVHSNLGELEAALDCNEESIRIAKSDGLLRGLQAALGNRANLKVKMNDFDAALSLWEEQASICRQLGYHDGLQRSIGGRATVLTALGRMDEALMMHQERERICRDAGHHDGLWRALAGQAQIRVMRHELDAASSLTAEIERLCAGESKVGLQRALGLQATIESQHGKTDSAVSLMRQQDALCREIGDPELLAETLLTHAQILFALQQAEVATRTANEVLGLAETHGLSRRRHEARLILESFKATVSDRRPGDEAPTDPPSRPISAADQLNRTAERLFVDGRAAEALTVLEDEERLRRSSANVEGLLKLLGQQVFILRRMGNTGRMHAVFARLQAEAEAANSFRSYAEAITHVSSLLCETGEFEQALGLLRKQEPLWRLLGDAAGLQKCLYNSGVVLRNLGQFTAAMKCWDEQARIGADTGDTRGRAMALGSQGALLADFGKIEGLVCLESAERLFRQVGDLVSVAQCCTNKALLLAALGRLSEAKAAYRVAHDVATSAGQQHIIERLELLRKQLHSGGAN